MERQSGAFDITVATLHYRHMRDDLRRLLDEPEAATPPCPCPHCTGPADRQVMESLRFMAMRLRRYGCDVSVPEKISRSQGMDALAAMTRTLHAINPLTSHAGS